MSEENQPRKRKGGSSNGSESKERARPFQGRYNPKHSDKYGMVSHKTIAKFVMLIGAVIFVVYSSYRTENVHPMAKVNEILEKKRHAQFLCHPQFKKEIQELSETCVPAKCGRFVVDDLVSVEEAHKLLVLAKKGLAKGGGNGGASILDLHSGALSHGDNFINLYKSHPDLFTARDFETYRTVKNRVKAAVAEHFNLDNNHLYLSHPTFFSELTSVPAVTVHDEYWHPHIDKVSILIIIMSVRVLYYFCRKLTRHSTTPAFSICQTTRETSPGADLSLLTSTLKRTEPSNLGRDESLPSPAELRTNITLSL